jgi:hypothetical protein
VSGDPDPVVQVRGLARAYGTGAARVEALRGIDLDVRRGEFVAVMGLPARARAPSCTSSAASTPPAPAPSASAARTWPPSTTTG